MSPIQPMLYNQIPGSSILRKLLSTPQKVTDATPAESVISKVAESSIQTSDQKPKAKRAYNRVTRRNLRKELEDQGFCVEGMSRGRKDYLANKDVKLKKQIDAYWADPEKYKEKQKEYKIRKKALSTLKKTVTKIQRGSPEILKLITENDLYDVLPNDKISVYIEKIGDIKEIYINREAFFNYIGLK